MIITTVAPAKGGRLAVSLDGRFAAYVRFDAFYAAGLAEGAPVDTAQWEALLSESNRQLCKEKALRLLSRQSYTCVRLEEKLCREFDEASAAAAVERMRELGLVNDEAYGRRIAEELYTRKGCAPRLLARALAARGIDRQVVEEILGAFDEADNPERAARLLYERYGHTTDTRLCRRAAAWLERLGYTGWEISRAFELLDEI